MIFMRISSQNLVKLESPFFLSLIKDFVKLFMKGSSKISSDLIYEY